MMDDDLAAGMFLVFVLIIILALCFITSVFPHMKLIKTTDLGTHSGYVTSVETNGIFFKSDKVYFKSDTSSSQEDEYCVEDAQIKQQLIKYAETKTFVTITFEDYLLIGRSICKGESALIIGVEENKK